jgi:cellulose synthase/poly-beta-1,6-N-acetylglucosamine synthase-like glycosyltransferase
VVSRLRPRTPIDLATARVSVLVPVYNERDTVETIVDLIQSSPIQKKSFASTTPRPTVRKRFSRSLLAAGKIDTLFRQPVNCGKGAAIRRALSLSTGDIVIVQDADSSTIRPTGQCCSSRLSTVAPTRASDRASSAVRIACCTTGTPWATGC